ncbi:putative transcriptional regulator [Janibacter sp. HTCC2649]|uniref:helix-turn-helix domain-containing protein n=1 Tax=Janibacter sp. HTCC2649 TaxID=313589 RepID=UPI0000670A90|nr:helix-turn-helix domain-containing protein [Janibacter sp. HTCC2649]EAQ00893.1 putative transcriptional regulator [Janibacter sp. HTCC2649]
MGQQPIRRVRFIPPSTSTGDIEVNTLKGIRDRGGPHEFLTTQRLDFDLLVHVEQGSARHIVDFNDHALGPGDVLWVRAGQVHHWGAIEALEGNVAMFGPHTLDERTSDLLRSYPTSPRSHWSATDLANTPVPQALGLLVATGAEPRQAGRDALHQAALSHSLAALLVHLSLSRTDGGPHPQGAKPEVYIWFRDHLEEHYRRWHKVGDYADRLGYSARTLNRLARRHTGMSAKELIDERILLEAKRQLSHVDASIADIAEDLGFDDASNFSSYFRRQTQLTPGAFRTQSRLA